MRRTSAQTLAEPDLTLSELADAESLLQSGQARLLRLVAQDSLESVGKRINLAGSSVCRFEYSGDLPRKASVRVLYYRYLCELRDRYGTVEVARRSR